MSPVLGVLVSAALALGPAPARLPQRFEDLEALVSDLAAQKSYQALADAAGRGFERRDLDAGQRRLMAFFAIQGLHGVYKDTGTAANLCRARRLLRRVERELGLAGEASTAARLGKTTAKLLAESGGEKQCSKSVPATRPVALASRPSPTPTQAAPSDVGEKATASTPVAAPEAIGPAESTPAEEAAATPAATSPTVQDDLVAVTGRPSGHVSNDMFRTTQKETQREEHSGADLGRSTSTPSLVPDVRRRSVALTRGGVALLSLGVVAGGVFGASLHYRGHASDTIDALAAAGEQRGGSTPEALARAQRLNQSYQNLTALAGVSGTLAIAGVVGGVVLLALKPRRTSMAAAPWATPTGAGLTFRGNF